MLFLKHYALILIKYKHLLNNKILKLLIYKASAIGIYFAILY